MKEQIKAILDKYVIRRDYFRKDESMVAERPAPKDKLAADLEKLFRDDIDLAYCAGIWNTGGIDVLSKELKRLKHIGRKPHQIFQRYKPDMELAEIKLTPIPSGWICPRCQKVHNWMVQSCDCSPNVITASTTEPIKELAENKVCIHRDGRLCSNANSDYLRCPGECSEAEYPI